MAQDSKEHMSQCIFISVTYKETACLSPYNTSVDIGSGRVIY